MRRVLISYVLPTLFCSVPIAAAAIVAAVIPPDALDFFLRKMGAMDYFILGLGGFLFLVQTIFCWYALQWQGTGFHPGTDRWVNHLAQAAEWFPMLGLLGTVGGILQTFGSFEDTIPAPSLIIQRYAPAITATGAGLYMAFINILPSWMVIFGRDLILTLGGGRSSTEETPP